MTNAPVLSITDELIAELESMAEDASDLTPDSDAQEYLGGLANRLLALMAERAELKRDAERYRWLVDQGDSMQWQNIMRIEVDDYATIGDAINEVMRQEGRL